MVSPCVVDTNVPKIANQHLNPSAISGSELACVLACVNKIKDFLGGRLSLVLVAEGEIFTEYLQQLTPSEKNGLGNAFMKWVNDHRWGLPDENRVSLHKIENGYKEFPNSPEL